MRNVARAAAFAVALLVVGRGYVVAGGEPAIVSASVVMLVVLVGALTLWSDGIVTASGVALAAHYLVSLWVGGVVVDLAVPVVGALILLYLDLADLAASIAPGRRVDRVLLARTAGGAGLLVLGAAVAGLVTFAFAAAPWPSAEWLRAAGAFGVGAVTVTAMILARRQSVTSHPDPAPPRPDDDRLRSRAAR